MDRFLVEVCYALPERVDVREVSAATTTTVREVIGQSGVLQRHPGIDITTHGVGRFGRPVSLDETVLPGDRIEIYRPLTADPKEQRRRAARRA